MSWLRLLLTPPSRTDGPFYRWLLLVAAVLGVLLVLTSGERLLAVGPWAGRAGPLLTALGAVWSARAARRGHRMATTARPPRATWLGRRAARVEAIGLPVGTGAALLHLWRPAAPLALGAMVLVGVTAALAMRWRLRAADLELAASEAALRHLEVQAARRCEA